MKKKQYIAPAITAIEIEATRIMAGSPGLNKPGTSGDYNKPKPGTGSGGHYAPSRDYFNSWTNDDESSEEYDYQ